MALRPLLFVFFMHLFVPSAWAAPTTYELDPASSKLKVNVFRDKSALASEMAHDHVVVAKGWSGTITFDPENLHSCAISISVPVSELQPDEPSMREAEGWKVMLTEEQQKQVKEHMLSRDQLNAESHPNITFEGAWCTDENGGLTVHGNLTIRGTTKAFSVPMSLEQDGKSIQMKGSLEATHNDFGFVPYAAFLGALKNREDFKLSVDLQGTAK